MSYLAKPLHPHPSVTLQSDTTVLLPATAALHLASAMVDVLEKKVRAEQIAKENANDEDGAQELQEDLMDLSITQRSIDPATWAANRATEGE